MKKFFSLLIAILIFAAPAVANPITTDQSDVYKISSSYLMVTPVDIENFSRVDDDFYRGSQPDDYDIKTLESLGIKTIINLRKASFLSRIDLFKQQYIARSLGINFINIPMTPNKPPTKSQIDHYFKILDNPDNLPVYVHCAQGKDRTGIMTALYRVKKYGWDFNQTYSEMKYRGYHSLIFPQQKDFLSEYINSQQRTRNN